MPVRCLSIGNGSLRFFVRSGDQFDTLNLDCSALQIWALVYFLSVSGRRKRESRQRQSSRHQQAKKDIFHFIPPAYLDRNVTTLETNKKNAQVPEVMDAT